jgi:small subunit ribosomal protein S16
VAVKIKLKRLGKIRAPYYRIVVADARTKRDGRAIEEIGKYHPKAEPSFIEVNSERALHWLSVGAQPTDPVRKIFEITGDWQKFKGLPGTEGTLKTAAPREDKKEIFAAAVKETLSDTTDAQKGRGPGRAAGAARRAAKPAAAGSQDAPEAAASDSAPAKADKPQRAKSGSGKGGRGSRAAQAEDSAASDSAASDSAAEDTAAGDTAPEDSAAAGTGEAKAASPADPEPAAGSE